MRVSGEIISIKLRGNFLARKYTIGCSLRDAEGYPRTHPSGLVTYSKHFLTDPEFAIIRTLTPESVKFSKAESNKKVTVLLNASVVHILNRSQNRRMDLEQVKGSLADSENFQVLEVDGYTLILPADFIATAISKRDTNTGVIPVKVICNGKLRTMNIRFKKESWY